MEEIPPNKWPSLSIREIKPDDILDELREKGINEIVGEHFNEEDRNAVLRELIGDKDLWSELPFHETVTGELVRITCGKAFLETDITIPEELYDYADIIRRSKDPTIKRQQQDWLEPLASEGVISISLSHEEPSKFWRLIMDHLKSSKKSKSFTDLSNTAWLLDLENEPVKPSDVISLENMQDEVDRLLTAARGAFWSPSKLHEELRNHSAFSLLKESCFAIGKEGLERLALLLAETQEYHVGEISCQHENLHKIIKTLSMIPAKLNLPGWNLLASAIKIFDLDICVEILLAELFKPISISRITTILQWLQEEHRKVGKGLKSNILLAFNTYLTAFVSNTAAKDCITSLNLLNRDGNWMPTAELCADAEGVADSHLLDDEQKQILKGIISHADLVQSAKHDNVPKKSDLQPEILASADNLEEFFAEWEHLVAPEIICAFLSLLGDDRKMIDLAERYRGRHSVEWVRDNIPWEVHQRRDELHRLEWMYGLDQHQALARHRFIVTCADGDMAKTCSILGRDVEVPLKSDFTSLITGGLFYEYSQGNNIVVRIRLRRPDIEVVTPSLLKASAEYLLNKAYNQRNYDLGRLWEELDKSEQLDIRIAQQLVLNHIPFYLRQLGVHKHPHLEKLLGEWDDIRYKREEYYESADKRESYEEKSRSLLKKIQDLLKSDPEVQEVVLNAVRAKMRDFQYTVASIPFELFQNADDALVELAEMKAYPDKPKEI